MSNPHEIPRFDFRDRTHVERLADVLGITGFKIEDMEIVDKESGERAKLRAFYFVFQGQDFNFGAPKDPRPIDDQVRDAQVRENARAEAMGRKPEQVTALVLHTVMDAMLCQTAAQYMLGLVANGTIGKPRIHLTGLA